MADLTGGSYYRAEKADQLLEVFPSLPSQITLQNQSVEPTVAFSAAGVVFVMLAVALSLWWNRFLLIERPAGCTLWLPRVNY